MPRRSFQNGKESVLGASLLALLLAGTPAKGQDDDLAVDPAQVSLGLAQLSVGGRAGGALFDGNLGAQPYATGAIKLMPRLHRDYDSGLSLGLAATLTASDPLSRGRYGGDVVEKFFGEAVTGLGRVEIGVTDGAGYDLAVTGPKVDAQVSLDDPQTSFFRDPDTNRAIIDLFPLRTAVGASSNYAKFTYVSPELFGLQLGFSFTPNQNRLAIPFLHEGPAMAGRQSDIWESAIRYSDDVGPLTLTGYGGFAFGRGEHKLSFQEGVSDLGLGARADYAVNDDLGVSLGGSHRRSNAYGFDIAQSERSGASDGLFTSAGATYDAWILGIEYGAGRADGEPALPRLGLTAYQASLGYVVNRNWEIGAGWQRLDYSRSEGAFFNASPQLGMDTGFLHLSLHV
ncbi:MAG: hypothetical protein ACREFW_07275 [Rhizomicrobium sp.]